MNIERPSVMYNYVRSRQLEGSFDTNPKTGCSIVSSYRILKGCGSVKESEFPYNGNADEWPPIIPEGIDILAKENRIGAYQRIRSVSECKISIDRGIPVLISIQITNQWKVAVGGLIEMPSEKNYVLPVEHSILLVGFNDETELFKFCNCWGGNWGDEGVGYLPYNYFEQYFSEAWIVILSDDTSNKYSSQKGIKLLDWGIIDVLDHMLFGIEIYDYSTAEFLAWSFSVVRDGFFEVEEFFVRPDSRFRNNASKMSLQIKTKADQLNLPLKLWISHIDNDHDNLYVLEKIFNKFGLCKKAANVPWASYQFV